MHVLILHFVLAVVRGVRAEQKIGESHRVLGRTIEIDDKVHP